MFCSILAGIFVITELIDLPVSTGDDDFDLLASSLSGSAVIVALFFCCTGPCVIRFIENRRLRVVRVVELIIFIFATLIIIFLSYGFVYELRD